MCKLEQKEEIDKIFTLSEIFSSPMSIYKACVYIVKLIMKKVTLLQVKNYFENYVKKDTKIK